MQKNRIESSKASTDAEEYCSKRFKYIADWHKQPDRRCCVCGEKRSVKYDFMGKQYCNLCIVDTF